MASTCAGDDRAGLCLGEVGGVGGGGLRLGEEVGGGGGGGPPLGEEGGGGGGGLSLGEVGGGGCGALLIGNTMPFFFHCMMELTASPSVSTPSPPGMSSCSILQAG